MTRVIAGAAGSLRLEVPPSGTRPTSDRVREAVFSTLSAWDMIEGRSVLDLYAGSGALGIEAASRGASRVVLVERHAAAARIAARNAALVTRACAAAHPSGTVPEISVAKLSVQSFLSTPNTSGGGTDLAPSWDVALLDPPYDLAEEELAENLVALLPLLREDAVVLVERSSRSPEPLWPRGMSLIRQKRYGETTLWWAELASPE